jgi:hypothetical protein
MPFVLTAPLRLSETVSIPAGTTGVRTSWDTDHLLLTFDVSFPWGDSIVLDIYDTEPEVWEAIAPSMTDPPLARSSMSVRTLRIAAAVLIALGIWEAGECTVAAASNLAPVIGLVLPLLGVGRTTPDMRIFTCNRESTNVRLSVERSLSS